MKQLRYILILLVAICISLPIAAQQTRVITGVVLDEKNEPIIGASITIPDTKVGTVTNIDGKFTLNNISANSKTIVVRYIGYQAKTIDLSNKSAISVKLEPSNTELTEVVKVGYTTQKKAHLTGAISTVDTKEIADLTTTDLSSTLRGRVTGLSVAGGSRRPGESGTITIRNSPVMSALQNTSGFVADNRPMYIIDDVISTESAFNNLDPTMVESISVLKDAAAAIYGSNSAYGVILVKTKRGSVGTPKVSYNGQFGLTDEIKRTKMLDSYNYGKIWNGVRNAEGSEFTESDNLRYIFQSDELQKMKKLNYDLLEQEWKVALTQKHSINVSGGTETATYFGGASYVKQEGNIGKLSYDRWNYSAGLNSKIGKSVKVSFQVSGDYGKQNTVATTVTSSNGGETDYNYLLTRPRYIPEYVNGLPISAYGVVNSQINTIQWYHYNTIQNLGTNKQNMFQNTNLNASIEYDAGWIDFLKGLKFKLSYGKSINTAKTNQYSSKFYLYEFKNRTGSGSHLYDEDLIDMSNSNVSRRTINDGNDIVSRTMNRGDNYQFNFTATYDRKFGQHELNTLFTIEKSETENEDLTGSQTGLFEYANGQSNSAIDPNNTASTSFGRTESARLSYAGRINYAYANKYLFEALFRVDASTRFAPENYWGFFPSASAGWVLSEEEWFRNALPKLDFFKLRGSFGLLGRDNLQAWQWALLYNANPDKGPIFGTSSQTKTSSHLSLQDNGINRLAHWDKNYQFNGGIDINMLNSRLSISTDAYYYWGRDIFTTRQGTSDYPATVGVKSAAENYGSIDRYGIELSVGWKDKIGNVKYNVRINTEYADDKIIKAAWPSQIAFDDQHPGKRQDTGVWGYECIGMFRSYQEIEEYFKKNEIVSYMGMTKSDVRPGMLIYNNIRGSQKADGTYYDKNDPNDPNKNRIDNNDRIQISKRSDNPYGFNLSFGCEWKGISINTRIRSSWGSYTFVPQDARSITNSITQTSGYDVMQYTNLPSFWANNMFVYSDVKDAQGNIVAEKNINAKYPNLRYASNNVESTFWRVSATTVTLDNLVIAFALPKNIIKLAGIESCRFNITGQDLLSLYNPYPDNFMDPLSGTYGKYPNVRKVTIGVNVTF